MGKGDDFGGFFEKMVRELKKKTSVEETHLLSPISTDEGDSSNFFIWIYDYAKRKEKISVSLIPIETKGHSDKIYKANRHQ